MPGFGEMLYCHPSASEVVHHDTRSHVIGENPVHQHQGRPVLQQRRKMHRRFTHWRNHQAVHTAAKHELDRLRLDIRAFLRVRHQH